MFEILNYNFRTSLFIVPSVLSLTVSFTWKTPYQHFHGMLIDNDENDTVWKRYERATLTLFSWSHGYTDMEEADPKTTAINVIIASEAASVIHHAISWRNSTQWRNATRWRRYDACVSVWWWAAVMQILAQCTSVRQPSSIARSDLISMTTDACFRHQSANCHGSNTAKHRTASAS